MCNKFCINLRVTGNPEVYAKYGQNLRGVMQPILHKSKKKIQFHIWFLDSQRFMQNNLHKNQYQQNYNYPMIPFHYKIICFIVETGVDITARSDLQSIFAFFLRISGTNVIEDQAFTIVEDKNAVLRVIQLQK